MKQAGVVYDIKSQWMNENCCIPTVHAILLWFNVVRYYILFQYFFRFTIVPTLFEIPSVLVIDFVLIFWLFFKSLHMYYYIC